MESVFEISIANDSTFKAQLSGTSRYLKSGKWSKKISKAVEPNQKTKGIVSNPKGKVSGSFKIEVNGETFLCCFEYDANESIPPAFSCTNRAGDNDSTITITHNESVTTDGAVGVVEMNIAIPCPPKPSAFQVTLVNKTNEIIQIGKLSTSGEWLQQFKPSLYRSGSMDTAKAVTESGQLTGSFLVKVDNEVFNCSFSYEAGVTKPTFFAFKNGISSSAVVIKGSPIEMEEGVVEAMVSIESTIIAKACSSYSIVVLNAMTSDAEVTVSNMKLTNDDTMSWKKSFQDSNVHLNYAKASAEGIVEGSFTITVNDKQVFDCVFAYDTNDSDNEQPLMDITSEEELAVCEVKVQTPVVYDSVAITMITVLPAAATKTAPIIEEATVDTVDSEITINDESAISRV